MSKTTKHVVTPTHEHEANNVNAAAAPEAAAAQPEKQPEAAAAEPTSEKLKALISEAKQLFEASKTLEYGTPAFNDNELARFNATKAIAAEKIAIAQAAREAEIEAKRSAKLALLHAAIDAEIAATNEPDNDELAKAANEAFDVVANLLVGTITPTTAKASSSSSSRTSGSRDEIIAQHVKNVAAGMTDGQSNKQLREMGYKRSTVWHAINDFNHSK